MPEYSHNKIRTIVEIAASIQNWPTAIALRLFRNHGGLRLLAFRNGLNVVCRGATRDWDVIHELLFAGSYSRALQFLKAQSGSPVVIDLGANIGLFSLLAARANESARVIAFEPGPPNQKIFQINQLANSKLSERIELKPFAVGGAARSTEWFFDEHNPGGSGLYSVGGRRYPVEVSTFTDVVRSLGKQIALLKIDIEGAEYEIMAQTPPEIWRCVDAVSLELHGDPENKMTQQQFLDRMLTHGFRIGQESVCTYFLSR
jgi:FkbM family methyltransferase